MKEEMWFILLFGGGMTFFCFAMFYFAPMQELQSDFKRAYIAGDFEKAKRIRNLILDRQRASWIRRILVKIGIAHELD